jgi:hypothetical protein
MRVLVCGGRDYADTDHIFATLDRIDAERGPIECLIHGAASGADLRGSLWAERVAEERPIRIVPFPVSRADWRRLGRAAGPIRNAQMIAEGKPDLVIAFPGNEGTADMTRQAREAGIEVIPIAPRGA